MKNVFAKSNESIRSLFDDAGSLRKVMCVVVDYAKKTHTAMICNGNGDQLRGTFHIHNNPDGIAFVEKTILGLCKKHSIQRKHVFVGGEDCAGFAFNFVYGMASRGWLVIGVNARAAHTERENMNASTDALDLKGIASVLINKKHGRTISPEHGVTAVLLRLTHQRNSLVRSRTASALRVHHLVDQLLPGFLEEKISGVCPFSRASLWLMNERFSPKQIRRRSMQSMAQQFSAFAVHHPRETAKKVKELAASALPPPESMCECLQSCLTQDVAVYQALNQSIHQLDLEIARKLAGTPGAMLTTLRGIGMTLASGLYAELGDPMRQRPLVNMASFAGIVDRLKQTGGPEHEARSLGRTRRGNRTAKRLVVEIALKIKIYGHDELKSDYSRREAIGQDARFTMGRKMLRICMHLIRNSDFFVPESLRQNPSREAMREYYQKAWPPMLVKWRNAGAIKEAFAKDAPLEQWRCMLNELYGLNLSNISPQAWQLR